jgi:hypothetical protein
MINFGDTRVGALMMMTLVATFALVLAAAGAAYGQPSPVPLGPGGSCPYGWAGVGSYCQPPRGAQGAVPIGPGGSCPPVGRGGRLVLPAAGRFVPSAVEARESYAGALEQEARRQWTPAN